MKLRLSTSTTLETEIYLPFYGRIQKDAMSTCLFKGAAIELGHEFPIALFPNFHNPKVYANVGRG